MISIISATNRRDAKTLTVAKTYKSILDEMGTPSALFSMEAFNGMLIQETMYDGEQQDPRIKKFQEEAIISADRLIIVLPEYNGGVPGIFKFVVDAMSVKDYKQTFSKRKVCLTGVSSGRAGNLRGLDYLGSCLQYLGMNVFGGKLPISGINTLLTEEGALNENTQNAIQKQIDSFLAY